VVLIASNTIEWAEIDQGCLMGGFLRVAPITRLHPAEQTMIIEDAEPTVLLVEDDWVSRLGTGWIPAGMIRNTISELPGLNRDDVAIHTAPLSHFSGAFGLAVYAAGGTNIVCRRFDTDRIIHSLNSHEATILPLVPTQVNLLTDELVRRRDAGSPVDTSSLRTLIYAGSAIAPDRLARAESVFGDVLVQFYGASEAPMPITALHPEDHVDQVVGSGSLPRLASAGRPNRFVKVRITNADGGELGANGVGEIQVQGEQTMKGYWRMPEATAEVIDQGWVRTGDMGYLDDEGYLFIVDRKKDMIVSGGFNVYPREVENVISAMPEVREVAVVGAPSDKWGDEITAIVSLRPGASMTADEVIARCREAIAGYKLPKKVLFADDLPKTATGKINKRSIADNLWAGRERRV
jgi:acyl-CoA synthetase (AMP-forming)/AMP-acid ligase II